jgi:hypothetical protein
MKPMRDRWWYARLAGPFLFFSCANPVPVPAQQEDAGQEGLGVELLEAPSQPTGIGSEIYADADAILVIEEVGNAVWAVAGEDPATAREILKTSLEKVAALRKRNEGADRLPITVTAEVVNTAPHELGEIHARRGQALRAIRAGRLPEARQHLSDLVSELRVSTTNVSLGEWKSGMSRAADMIAANRGEDACNTLAETFANMTEESAVRPLPLALAEKELNLAIAAGGNRETARSRLEEARFQLRRAEALGYTGEANGYGELKSSIRSAERSLRASKGHQISNNNEHHHP